MKLSQILKNMGETGVVVKYDGLTRRQVHKMIQADRRTLTRMVRTENLMRARAGRTHEHKVHWPVRDETFVLEAERRTRDLNVQEHPLITARRRQYPDTTKK